MWICQTQLHRARWDSRPWNSEHFHWSPILFHPNNPSWHNWSSLHSRVQSNWVSHSFLFSAKAWLVCWGSWEWIWSSQTSWNTWPENAPPQVEASFAQFRRLMPDSGFPEILCQHIGELYVDGMDTPLFYMKVTRNLPHFNSEIIECRYDSDRMEWIFMWERTDKSLPNSYKLPIDHWAIRWTMPDEFHQFHLHGRCVICSDRITVINKLGCLILCTTERYPFVEMLKNKLE